MTPVSGKSAGLAIDGGSPVRRRPWPHRSLFGKEEMQAVAALFKESIAKGEAFGYQGPQEEAYCREFARFMGGGYADAVNSGTNAVFVALRSLNLEPFTEVVIPPVTDPGGAMPVPLLNCIPIPADSAPGSYNAGPEQIAARVNKRTSAILVAHIAGVPVDMAGVMKIARARGIPVIEDCAQAHGAKYKGRRVGSIGDIGVFSTMFGKHHASGGQGGIVFTTSKRRYWQIRQAADRGKPFGITEPTSNVIASLNCNSDELSCAVGRAQFKKLPAMIRARRKSALAIARGCRSLKTVSMVTGPENTQSVFWFLLFKLDLDRISVDKATFVKALQAEGLPAGASYLHVPVMARWYKERAVFGTSGYPWTCPLYKGNPDRKYSLKNIIATDACHFLMSHHEKVGPREVADTVSALKKVEAAYAK